MSTYLYSSFMWNKSGVHINLHKEKKTWLKCRNISDKCVQKMCNAIA